MVRHLCERDDAVAVVAGKAGTGKTFALAAAREAWEAAGYPVRGAAVARRAARELLDGAGHREHHCRVAGGRQGAAEAYGAGRR